MLSTMPTNICVTFIALRVEKSLIGGRTLILSRRSISIARLRSVDWKHIFGEPLPVGGLVEAFDHGQSGQDEAKDE